MGTGANMVRSLLVVGALVLGLVMLVPRVSEVKQPPVDAAGVVAAVVAETHLPLLFPTGPDAGWTATNARYAAFADQIPTWQVGWTGPDDQYLAIKQAVGVTPAWLDAATAKGREAGTELISGRSWQVRVDDRRQTHLVSTEQVTGGVLTTVVSGTGGLAQVRDFVARLAPAAAAR
jgi:hypothetical protein